MCHRERSSKKKKGENVNRQANDQRNTRLGLKNQEIGRAGESRMGLSVKGGRGGWSGGRPRVSGKEKMRAQKIVTRGRGKSRG